MKVTIYKRIVWAVFNGGDLDGCVASLDSPEKAVTPEPPGNRFWTDVPAYQAYFEEWKDRPEYEKTLKKLAK